MIELNESYKNQIILDIRSICINLAVEMTNTPGAKYQEWFKQLRLGNSRAFENIYNEFWDSLYAIAYNRLKSKEAVEDILQNLFTDLWSRRGNLNIRTSVGAYLHAALKYKILNHINSQTLRKTYNQEHPQYAQRSDDSTQKVLEFEELYESLQLGLEKLPKKCSLIFKMSREEQKSSREIAEKLNISHRTVHTHIYNAIKFLKSELADYKAVIIVISYYF